VRFLTSGLFTFLDLYFLITKLFLVLQRKRGDCGNYYGCLQFLVPEERRHALEIGVSIDVHGR
jgi:hypothetical protein